MEQDRAEQGILMGRHLHLRTVDTRKVPNPTVREKRCSGRCPNSVAADEAQQNRDPTASAEAKLTLRRIAESQNSYAPLKSIAISLCFVLDNCKV